MKKVILPTSNLRRKIFVLCVVAIASVLGIVSAESFKFVIGTEFSRKMAVVIMISIPMFFFIGLKFGVIIYQVAKRFSNNLIINIKMRDKPFLQRKYIYSKIIEFEHFLSDKYGIQCNIIIKDNICSLSINCNKFSDSERKSFIKEISDDFYKFCKPLQDRISDLKKITTLQYKMKKQALDIEKKRLEIKVIWSTLKQHKYYIFFGFLMAIIAIIGIVVSSWK
jgi:hypothetical protein